MATEPELWPLGRLRAARADDDGVYVDLNNPIAFTIPSFQRALVWPPEKQRRLIASIMKGFPFGALLLVRYPDKKLVIAPDGTAVMASNYGIIDGLQRTNAIVEHLKNSLAYAGAEAVEGEALDGLADQMEAVLDLPIDRAELIESVVYWMHELRAPDITRGFDFDSLIASIFARLGLESPDLETRTELKVAANLLLHHIDARVNISDLKVPVLIYDGPDEYLPEIFEQINTAGTVLSKYEVFAAAWAATLVKIDRAEIRAAIGRKYAQLEDQGFSIEAPADGAVFSLFDYLHGLSQYLGERFPLLFSKKDAEKNKLSGAFPIATLMLGQSLDKMSRLHILFPTEAGYLNVNAFEAALIESAEIVSEILGRYLAFRFQNDGETFAHGELQIASMVAAVAAHLFDHQDDFARRNGNQAQKKLIDRFETALPQHYIHDVIRQFWRGSLYTYASERVWEGDKPSSIYLTPVDASAFDLSVRLAWNEQLADVGRTRKKISAADRAVLRFLYSPVVSVQDQNSHKFDVEHLMPFKRLLDLSAQDENAWPIGALGNLAVLPRGVNRKKQEETVTEYVARPSRGPTPPEEALLRKMILINFDSIRIDKVDGKDSLTKDEYLEFVNANWAAMTAALKSAIGIAE